jgi:hypothetical protein
MAIMAVLALHRPSPLLFPRSCLLFKEFDTVQGEHIGNGDDDQCETHTLLTDA